MPKRGEGSSTICRFKRPARWLVPFYLLPPMPTIPSLLVAAACLLLPIFLWLRKSKSAPAPLPPGPKPVPLLGNIRELRPQELWLPANDWAKQYGISGLPLS